MHCLLTIYMDTHVDGKEPSRKGIAFTPIESRGVSKVPIKTI